MFDPQSIPGFLNDAEGRALARHARQSRGLVVEIGSYCGRAAAYMGAALKGTGHRLVTVDTHQGSPEQQPGQAYHNADFDDATGQPDTLPHLRHHLQRAGVSDAVIVMVATSAQAARLNLHPAMVFIDGAHSIGDVLEDWRSWGPQVQRGGILALHDVYADPLSGGRAPASVAHMITASGLYDPLEKVGSLIVWRRV